MEREARKTILSPGESADPYRNAKREGVHAQDPFNFTLFSQVERKYKHINESLDLNETFDLKKISSYPGVKPFITHLPSSREFQYSLVNSNPEEYTFDAIPGFLIFPGLLSKELQVRILNPAFYECMKHPNLCNLDEIYSLPTEQPLLKYIVQGVSVHKIRNSETPSVEVNDEFIRKIRWYTIWIPIQLDYQGIRH